MSAHLQWLSLLLLLFLLPFKDTRPQTAQAAYDHAWHLLQQGDLVGGQQEAALGCQRFQSSNPLWAAKFKLLLAQSMLYRGMYDAALSTLSSYPDSANQEGTVQKMAIEAVALTRQQRLQLADQTLIRAETICRTADTASCGDVDTARAILEAKEGRLAEARQSFLRALAFARSRHNSWLEGTTTLNLGFIALQVDHFDEAVDWSRSAYRGAVASAYPFIAEAAAGNLGWAYYQLGDDERALAQFLAAEDTATRVGRLRDQLKWISDAGYVYRDTGDLPRAMDCYRTAFTLARELDSKEDIENALEDLAQVSAVNGNLRDAAGYVGQVAPMETADGGKLSPSLMLTKGELAAALHQDAEAEADFRSVWNGLDSLTTLRLNAGSELATLYESQGRIKDAEQMYKSALAVYESARATLRKEETQLPFGANANQVYDNYIRLLIKQGRSGEALTTADRSRARTLEQGLDADARKGSFRPVAIDPRRVARVSDATLLFYWLGDRQSYLWAITPGRIAMFPLPARKQIAARVQSYSNAILRLEDPRATGNQDGLWLYNVLIAPAKALLRPGKLVVILADGALSELNFDTLLVPGSGSGNDSNSNATAHYLLEDVTLVSAPSLAMLGAPQSVPNRGAKLLLLGDPVSPSQDFPSLPLFGYEMTKIESHFGKDQLSVFAGSQATPAAYFASHPSQYSYIHFVSHAIASRTDPLDSAIILSSPAADESSFKLYARDIIRQRIDARLVTISACYGSGTRFYAGEGLVGLSWAFLRAGAHRVIGALWEVSDVSTPRLMDSFYRNLADGNSPETSLRAAKLDLIHPGGRFSLPFYWAPFQMYERE
ncbi:MAG TPA: CHAT domain-containing tetratricopeptide repeat protein [Terracidiphilus sp.]|nr:CHAT domain-containing tetratricopeptide repeat protein [Terracidiphilus sp.]